jgi:hypothetical protein
MPFTSYDSAADVCRAYQIVWQRSDFVEAQPFSLADYFRSEIAFNLRELPFDMTEYSTTETLIFPMLREVWKPFRDSLMLWSHQPLSYDADLCGVPDYIVARRSRLGSMIFDAPYLLVIEAKKDDYSRGWAQCLAAMIAAQKLNGAPGHSLFGVVTNGRAWEFGKLQEDVFTQDVRPFFLQQLDSLASALHFVFTQCRDQAARMPPKVVA